jgi:hypothetical protein
MAHTSDEVSELTATAIENGWDSLYALVPMPKKSDTTPAEREALTKRVLAGEWLRTGQAAKVLDVSRSKVDILIRDGVIGHRNEPNSRYRQCNPADVQRLLAESQQERRGDTPATTQA